MGVVWTEFYSNTALFIASYICSFWFGLEPQTAMPRYISVPDFIQIDFSLGERPPKSRKFHRKWF